MPRKKFQKLLQKGRHVDVPFLDVPSIFTTFIELGYKIFAEARLTFSNHQPSRKFIKTITIFHLDISASGQDVRELLTSNIHRHILCQIQPPSSPGRTRHDGEISTSSFISTPLTIILCRRQRTSHPPPSRPKSSPGSKKPWAYTPSKNSRSSSNPSHPSMACKSKSTFKPSKTRI